MVARAISTSPGRTGDNQRSRSTPGDPTVAVSRRTPSTYNCIKSSTVCHPLATSPPNGVATAASSSTWNAWASHSWAKPMICSRVTQVAPSSNVSPTAKSSNQRMRRNVAVDCGEVESAMCHADLPLKGLRVLDFSRVLAGPYCTMLLADLGADVIKVEPPLTGDDTRGWGPPFVGDEATYFLAVNRGKRSCVINLRTEMGRKIAAKLAQSADVVVENFRPGTAYRLGIGYEQLRELNP